jgi:hypothetical protein
MYILTTGDTWYGFRPIEEYLIAIYENNRKIMNTITLKDIDLIKYLKMTKLNEKVIEKSKIFIEKHQLLLVKDYLTRFIKEYDKTCEYFHLHSIDFVLQIQLCAIVVLNRKILTFLYSRIIFILLYLMI